MKINQKHFYEFNFQDFVHVKYLKHVMKDVARIIADNIPDHKTIESLNFKTDKYGEQELHVTYLDYDNQEHDVLMKPAITDRVNELIDKRFRWIESGDEPIKKLEIKNHYLRITTDSTVADFEVPYIFNNGIEQDQLHVNNDDENYIKIKLVARNTHDEITLEVPTKKNFDGLKSDYEKFKEAFYAWQTEVNNHLTEIDKKNNEQDKRLTDVEQKNTEQDGRLTGVEQKNTDQDNRLTDVEQKNTVQDNEINGIKDHQTSVDRIIEILQQKSHDFLQQLKNPADFNAIKDDGNYFVYADDTPDNHLTGANRPSDHWGILYNYKHEPSNQVQIYAADTDNVLYMRTLNSSDWTPWQAVTTSTELQNAISELTKTLFNFYYDGLVTETSTDGKPVAAKAMIINDDKNLFKGIAVFNQAGELLKRIMLDDYATQKDIENSKIPTITFPYDGDLDEFTDGYIVDVTNSTVPDQLDVTLLPKYLYGRSFGISFIGVVPINNNRDNKDVKRIFWNQDNKVFYSNVGNFISTGVVTNQATNFDAYLSTRSIPFNIKKVELNNQTLTIDKTNIDIPKINTPFGNVENLLIDNSIQYEDQVKVTTALDNLGLDPTDVLNISQEKDQEKFYNNSNLIIKLDEVNSKLNGSKRIFYLSDNNKNPQEKQAIMELPKIMNDGDIVSIEFSTVYDHLDPSIDDDVRSAIQGDSKPILFIKTGGDIISNNDWYTLKLNNDNNINYLKLVSSNIKLNVTKDNYNFNAYSGTESQVRMLF
ncbi:pyocin knob domain-containing protein [Actinobacillus porcinus]|uniref:pyocin knob domain-containing protein n=1 Tax=Actinobacillus porcinus TaxID=51048 RepID=UPI0023547C6D|nr:pyocin knob domain-containing protein [Actinobacillus porcinus]